MRSVVKQSDQYPSDDNATQPSVDDNENLYDPVYPLEDTTDYGPDPSTEWNQETAKAPEGIDSIPVFQGDVDYWDSDEQLRKYESQKKEGRGPNGFLDMTQLVDTMRQDPNNDWDDIDALASAEITGNTHEDSGGGLWFELQFPFELGGHSLWVTQDGMVAESEGEID